MTTAPTARDRLAELTAKIDAFFARAQARYPGPSGITCAAGCNDCCRRFSVTALEAEILEDTLAYLAPEARERLTRRARLDEEACPALDPDGRCALYAARPLICRSHGLPIRFAPLSPAGARSLPVIDACPRNFDGVDLAGLDPSTILDQATVSTVLAALDAARSRELGVAGRERVEIAGLLARA